MHNLRPYQQTAFNKIVSHFKASSDPIIGDYTCGFGKTLLIAHLAKHVINLGGQVLSTAHTQELLSGAAKTYGENDCSIFCASLTRKELDKKMIYASPQSLIKALKRIPKVDLFICDEAHMIDDRNVNSVYMKIINKILKDNPKCRILGVSGTPFRLYKGNVSLLVGKKRLFKKIIDSVYIKDLLKIGFLTTPITPSTHSKGYDFSGLSLKMGKYQDKDLNEITQNERLTKTIIRESIKLCEGRKKILIFSATLIHAKEIQSYLYEFGESCGYIDGKLKNSDRSNELNNFANGTYRWMVNKEVLTVGYDETGIDAIILLFPSESRAKIIQILGRSLRLHEGKENSLILDFASNFDSLDDLLDNENIKSIDTKDKDKDSDTIICPNCGALCSEHAHKCKVCQYYFIFKECENCKTQNSVSSRHCINCGFELLDPNLPLQILPSGAEIFRARVINSSLSKHIKNKVTLRLDYLVNDQLNNFPNASQFLAEGTNHLKHWIHKHIKPEISPEPFYDSVDMIIRYENDFVLPEIISYKKNKKYFNVIED